MEGKWLGKENKIDVWMNGKKTKLNRNDHPEETYSIKEFSREHAAATLEDSNSNELPTLVRRHTDDSENESYASRKPKFSRIKPILLASISAIIIGSVLGFFMLNMFVDIESSLTHQENTVPAVIDDTEDEEDNNTTSEIVASPTTIDAVNAFVLQAGKFANEVNANEMAGKFNQEGFTAMLWKKDDFYYVLAGIANSKKQANQLANKFNEYQLEVYVKEWSTESSEIKLFKNENKWYQAYQEQWTDSLVSVSKQERMSKDTWEELVNTIPEETKNITELTDFLKTEYANLDQANIWQQQKLMLSLWHQLNMMIK